MPTDRDRKARREAERRLESSYGWPEPRRRNPLAELVPAALRISAVILGNALGIAAVVLGIALVLGWRP